VGILADVRTARIAGDDAGSELRGDGFVVSTLIVPDADGGQFPVCDDRTKAWVEKELPEQDLLVAVGSGVISDLSKWVAFERNVPYISVATAASMNGYASDNVAPTIEGLKSLFRGIGPKAIVTSADLLASAPANMTAAGLGDVMAKPVSTSDWRLNRILFDDYYCAYCAGLIDGIEPLYLSRPEAIGSHEPSAMRALFDALVMTGFAMSAAGTSAPASGGEHLVSHALDMVAMRDGTQHDLHGRQVGIATILGAALYEEILAIECPVLADVPPHESSGFWGRFSIAVDAQHELKRLKMLRAKALLQQDPGLWGRMREELRPGLRSPQQIKDCLRRAGAAHHLEDIGVTRTHFLEVLAHAHEIRERFTVLDLARLVRVLPERAESIVDKWLVN